MFNKLKTIKKFNNEIIDIYDLFKLVKSNPQKEVIDYIRGLEYKSSEYNHSKLKLSCITPHGSFKALSNDSLDKLSGYLYYDIDGIKNKSELDLIKQNLIKDFPISFICKSVGGKGLSFLIKIKEGLTEISFLDIYLLVREDLIKSGFNIDKTASGLVRKMIISSDENVYLNDKVSLSIDRVSLREFKHKLNKFKTIRKEGKDVIIPNDTFLEVINIENLLKEINIETLYTKDIDGDFVIEEMDYYKIILPKIIKDGTKHKLYTRVINALYYINPSISKQQVYSYLFYINNMATPKMNVCELRRLVNNLCNNIETTGQIKIKPRVKRLHFNKECRLTKKQKQNMGGQLGSKIRNNNTLRLIEEARMKCASLNISPTQKKIQELTGLGIATIKRNWNKEYNDLRDLKIDKSECIDEVQLERETKLNDLIPIDEGDFFNDI